jgi:hypothetical protein
MAITAKVVTSRTIVGSVSQGNQPQVTRVTVPGPKGDTGAAASAANISLNQISNVDVSTFGLDDGSLLQYSASTEKWIARTELDTTTGTIVFNGGSF